MTSTSNPQYDGTRHAKISQAFSTCALTARDSDDVQAGASQRSSLARALTMLTLANLREDTKVYLKVIQGQDPDYPDPVRRRWYPNVAFKQRMSCVACSLHTFFSLVLLAVNVIGYRRSTMGTFVSPLIAYNSFVFGTFGAVNLSLPGITTYLGVQVRLLFFFL